MGIAPRRFETLERSPGFLLWRATLSWQRQIRAALKPHDLTHVQFVLLASLWRLEDHERRPPTQAGIAQHARIDQMMTSQVIRKLESRGLLERAHDAIDSRARFLKLTQSGREAVGRAAADVEAVDVEYFEVLGEGCEQFIAALAKLDHARA